MQWESKQWKSVLEIKSGRSQKQVKNSDGQYPIYGSGGIMGYADDFICNEGTTIIGRKGTINRPIYVEEKFWNVDTAFGLSPSENLDSKFLYYFCLAYDFTKHDKGTTLPSLVKKDLLANVFMPVPLIAEQRRIVGILDEAFERIAIAEANTQKNLANAIKLFDSYLNKVFTGKDNNWIKQKLGNVCTLQRGFDLPKRLRVAGDFPLVSSSGIIDSHIEAKVKAPGVATGRSGSIGNLFYIEQDFWPLNTVLYVKDFHGNSPEFIFYLLRHFNLKKYSGGTGVPTLNRNHVHNVLVTIPESIQEQEEIVKQLKKLQKYKKQLEKIYQRKLEALAELKQSILQKAFTGQLT